MTVIVRRVCGIALLILGMHIVTGDGYLLKRYGRERAITGFEKNITGAAVIFAGGCLLLRGRDSDSE